MDLVPFLVMSAIGVGGLTWLVRRLDRRAPARLTDDEAVRARFAQDFPDEPVRRVARATDASAALLELARPDTFGLVVPLGRRFATRCFAPAQLARVEDHAGRLSLRFDDFTLPGVELELGAAAGPWRDRLRAAAQGAGPRGGAPRA